MMDRREMAPMRIYYPKSGTILALDPDIPLDRQRVFFEVMPAAEAPRLALDGDLLATASGWLPTPGYHQLTLFDEAGGVVDEVKFEVRGNLANEQTAISVTVPAY